MCNPFDHESNDDGNAYQTQPHCVPGTAAGSPLTVVPAAGVATEGRLILESFPLTFEGYTYAHGHIAYIEGRPPAPVIQVQHNYAGLKQFDIDQACFLARCGYVGLAVDLYREHDIIGADPELTYAFEDRDPKRDLNGYGQNIKGQVSDAQKARALRHGAGSSGCMMGLLRNPKHFRALMRAWLDHARTHPAVHPEYAGSIGYCLGGQSLLEQVRDGQNVQAVVSFHGLLHSRPVPFPGEHSATEDDPRGGYFERMTKEEFEAHPQIDNAPNDYSTNCKVLIENGACASRAVSLCLSVSPACALAPCQDHFAISMRSQALSVLWCWVGSLLPE